MEPRELPEDGGDPIEALVFEAFALAAAQFRRWVKAAPRALWPLPLAVAAVLVGSIRANLAADRLRPPLSRVLTLFRRIRLRKTPGRMAASSARMLRGPNLARRCPTSARGVALV